MGIRKEYDYKNSRLPEFTSIFRKIVDGIGGVTKASEVTGISRPTINFWYNGQRTPDAENLKTLSQSFHVSTDYLLGLTDPDNSTADEKLRMISEYTGLSNEAVQNLHDFLSSPFRHTQKKWCNYLLTSGNFMALSIGLSCYEDAFAKSTVKKLKHEKEDKEAAVIRFSLGEPSFDEAKCAAGWRLSEVIHGMTEDVEKNFGIDDEAFIGACIDLIEDETERKDFFEYAKSRNEK